MILRSPSRFCSLCLASLPPLANHPRTRQHTSGLSGECDRATIPSNCCLTLVWHHFFPCSSFSRTRVSASSTTRSDSPASKTPPGEPIEVLNRRNQGGYLAPVVWAGVGLCVVAAGLWQELRAAPGRHRAG